MNFLQKIKFSLSVRLLIGVLLAAGLIYLLTIRYINYDYEEVAIQMAKKTASQQADNVATRVKNIFDADFDLFRTYAHTFEQYQQFDSSSYRNFFNRTLERALVNNHRYLSTWDNWELRYVDSAWTLPHGRVSYTYFREGGFVTETIDSLDLHGDDTTSLYYNYKKNPREGITEPYEYTFSSGAGKKILMTSIIVPLMQDSSFVGMVGVDITLTRLKKLVDSLNTNLNGYTYILSNDGAFVAHPQKEKLGKIITDTDSLKSTNNQIIKKLKNGTVNKFVSTEGANDNNYYTTIVPVKFGNSKTYWGIAFNIPLNNIILQAQSHFEESRKVGVYGLLILILVTLIVAFQIIRPIKKTTNVLHKLSLGEIENTNGIKINTGDEIEQMSHSVNTVIEGFKNTVTFANHIKTGDFNRNFQPLSDKDVLGNAILEMRNSLKEAKAEEEQRQKEEEQSNWASHGINLFGNILRQNNDDLQQLSMRIISTLVDYLNAHQGGLYLTEKEKDKQHLELVASIGFDKEKKLHKIIQPNEGVVGKCLLEKERIYMDDIPEDYSPILSGLGKTLPGSSLVVPMLINEEVIGILEVGALQRMEEYQIQFVEKIAISIASTISSAKVNAQTAELLEKSKVQADELAQQEEEMRQNMEELQAMQEEATKRETSIQNFINAAKNTLLYVEYDMQAKIIDINNNMLKLFQLKREQVLDKQIGSYEFSSNQVKNNYQQIWSKLKKGEHATNNFYTKYSTRDYYLKEYYYPLLDEEGTPYKVINIAVDITEEKRKEKQLNKLKEDYEQLVNDKSQEQSKNETEKVSINEVFEQDSLFEYIDLTHLQKVYKDDLRKIQNIINIYVDTIPQQINELLNMSQTDLAMLKSKIGNFKTKMSYLGLTTIVEMAKEIETICATGSGKENLDELLNEIYQIWENAEQELKMIITK